jgi:outer membrane receptor protein involved in Fe transport
MRTSRWLSATALASALCVTASPVAAQQVTAPGASLPDAQDDTLPSEQVAPSAQGDIVVTGSRIRRTGYDTLEPALVVSEEYLQTRGLTNVADALNELPGFGVGVTPEGGQAGFGVGQNFVNRFGLGTSRTLTLVNGRRFVSSNAPTIFGNPPGVQVDLNVINSQLIERVDNVTIGGAPTYGSDAIAGVVNVILKRNFEGVEVRAVGGISERGDNGRYNLSILAGQNFAGGRGNVTAAVSYDKTNGVLAIDRERFRDGIVTGTNPLAGSASATLPGRTPANDGRVNPDVPFNTGNTDGIPNGLYIRNGRIFSLSTGGLLLPATGTTTIANGLPRGFGAANSLVAFDRSGNLVPYNPGVPFGPQNASGGDGLNLAETQQLTSDLERITGNLIARYEITDNVGVFFEGSVYRAVARELTDQSIYNATLFGGASGPLTFSVSDPRLTAQARTTLLGLGLGPNDRFRVSRGSRDLVENSASSETRVFRGVIGLEGNFQLFGNRFNWEASANYGRTEGEFFATVLNQQNFVNAINNCNPTPAFNSAPGGIAPIADPRCTPLDIFGEGRASAAARDYVTGTTTARTALEQQVYNVNVTGPLFNPWGAGDIAIAIGYEHRDEYAEFNPDAFQRAGLGRAVPIGGNRGRFNTDEVFGELLVPLVGPENNIPLVYSLTAEGRVRYVDNTVNGGFTTYTAGGTWSPFRDLKFRGNYTRSLRAPSITELFTPQSPSFQFFPDPCDTVNIAGGPNPSVRARNCQAFFDAYGINGATFASQARVASIPSLSGGDPTLANEEGRSYTFGAVFQPSFIPRFRMQVDWNRIRVSGNIASLTPANIAEGCYDNPDFDASNIDAANSFCSLFTRVRSGDATQNGQIVNDPANPGLRTIYVNGAYIEFKGLTSEASYNFNLAGVGSPDTRVFLSGNLVYTDTLRSSNNGVTVTYLQGTVGAPNIAAQFNVGVQQGEFGIDFQGNFQDDVVFNRLNTIENSDILGVGDYWTFNGSLSYRINDNSNFRLTVTNIFDRDAPFPLTGNGFGAYDFIGRRFVASVTGRF